MNLIGIKLMGNKGGGELDESRKQAEQLSVVNYLIDIYIRLTKRL